MSALSSAGRCVPMSRPYAPVSSLDSQISRTCDHHMFAWLYEHIALHGSAQDLCRKLAHERRTAL